MKKTLAVLLLLSLVVGCGSDAQKALEENTASRNANTEAIKAKNETKQSGGDKEKTLPKDDHPAESKATPRNDLFAALSGNRVHFKLAVPHRFHGDALWGEFHANGTAYSGNAKRGRSPGSFKWSVTGNKLTLVGEGGNDEDYVVFSDPALTVRSAVTFLASADESESAGMKATIASLKPIPPTSETPDSTPPEDE